MLVNPSRDSTVTTLGCKVTAGDIGEQHNDASPAGTSPLQG